MPAPMQMHIPSPFALKKSIPIAHPRALARLLEQNNIPSIGTHIFYQRMLSPSPNLPRNYIDYERNVFLFLSSLPASYISGRMVLVPECFSNMQETSKLLFSLGISATPKYFISADGTLASPNFMLDNMRPEEIVAENSNLPVYDRITAFAKEGRVFVFGLYADDCLLHTKDSLCSHALGAGFKLEIFENASLTLSSGRRQIA